VKVVAGDIFDDAAAGFGERSGAVDKFSADQEIARGAIGVAKSGINAAGDDSADGGQIIKRDGERKKLFLFVERDGEIVEGRSGVDADGEVGGIVVGDFVEAGDVECDVVARRRHADGELGAIAAGDDGKIFGEGEANDFGYFVSRVGLGDGGRKNFVDGILRKGGWFGDDMVRADGGLQASGYVERRDGHEMTLV